LASNQINRFVCPPRPIAPPPPPPSSRICPYYETQCPGLSSTSSLLIPLQNQVVSFRDFDVVAFGNLYSQSGDVEGRLAVQGNLDVTSFGIGFELWTINGPDNQLPYSLVVGGDASYGSGQVWPFGNNIDKNPAAKEDIFVGGNFNAPQYLMDRRSGSCGANTGCLNTWFNGAKNCYTGFSDGFAASQTNVVASILYGGLRLSCSTTLANRYVVNVQDTLFNQANYYFLDGCNFHAEWVINIVGNGPVRFTGGSFPSVAGGVIFNVPGTGRILEVSAIGLNAHLLAPNNDLNQTNSVIVGKVVVRNYINLNQVNRPCPNKAETPVTLSVVAANQQNFPEETQGGLVVMENKILQEGDQIAGYGIITEIVNLNNGQAIKADGLDPNTVGAGSVFSVRVDDVFQGRPIGAQPVTPTQPTSSAASLAFFGLVALLALMI